MTTNAILKNLCAACAVVLFACGQVRAAEEAKPAALDIAGEIEKPITLNAGDFKSLPRQTIRTQEKGKDIAYEGVLAGDLLKRAGVKIGDNQMRGEKMMLYVLAEASDGYKAVFALAEFDPDVSDKVFLIADRRDGQPLDAGEGPLRLIVPAEKMHSRWVKQLTMLRICRAPGEQKTKKAEAK